MDSWTIYYNGEEITLEDVQAMLDDPDCDLDEYIIVDGTIVTLGDVQTMLEIETYIAYLRDTYFTGQEWTQEQLANLESLMAQIESEGIQMFAAGEDTD